MKRIEEIDYWNIEESKKEETRNMMYKYLYLKYGTLTEEIKKLLIPRVNEVIIKEYEIYTDKCRKGSMTHV